MTTDRRIECEFKIPAAIDKVWLAITEAEHIRNWFAPHAESVAGKAATLILPGRNRTNPCAWTSWNGKVKNT